MQNIGMFQRHQPWQQLDSSLHGVDALNHDDDLA
jgi:hypothetical protein